MVAKPLPPDPDRARISDDPGAVQKIARRAEDLVAKGLHGKDFLRAFGLDDDGPIATITTMEELDACLASDNGCAPSS